MLTHNAAGGIAFEQEPAEASVVTCAEALAEALAGSSAGASAEASVAVSALDRHAVTGPTAG